MAGFNEYESQTTFVYSSIIPAKAGIQHVLSSPKGCKTKKCGATRRRMRFWIPAYQGNDGGIIGTDKINDSTAFFSPL
jgi:hypothetical protein